MAGKTPLKRFIAVTGLLLFAQSAAAAPKAELWPRWQAQQPDTDPGYAPAEPQTQPGYGSEPSAPEAGTTPEQ